MAESGSGDGESGLHNKCSTLHFFFNLNTWNVVGVLLHAHSFLYPLLAFYSGQGLWWSCSLSRGYRTWGRNTPYAPTFYTHSHIRMIFTELLCTFQMIITMNTWISNKMTALFKKFLKQNSLCNLKSKCVQNNPDFVHTLKFLGTWS